MYVQAECAAQKQKRTGGTFGAGINYKQNYFGAYMGFRKPFRNI